MARPAVLAGLFLVASATSLPALAAPPAGGALPPLPGAAPSSPSQGGQGPSAGPARPAGSGDLLGLSAEQVRKGVVQVEQGGRPIAVGTVLMKDGRVITAFSALAGVEQPEIRYADGTVVKAKIGHKDKAWDLALLIPQSGGWKDGLMPTDTDPQGADLRAFLPKQGKLAPAPIGVKGRVDAKSKEGDALKSALDVDAKGGTTTPGAPLIDASGRVVGILVKACKDAGGPTGSPAAAAPAAAGASAPCAAMTIAAPVYALRGFLMKTPANAIAPAPWLGLGGAPSDPGAQKGVRVMGVAPGSPAEKAGLKAGDAPDTIVAVDGQPVETPEQLAEVIAKRAIGQQVKFLVFSGGKFREAMVTLRATP
ncbi:MAG: PDZ domain-containing protein [Deltaproteobacteria bacterium]|nr:PDZ domain-containing protein [Deltaproteobacteria bacterium]